MSLFHLAKNFAMTIRESANDGSDFTNPDADFRRLFLGEDGLLHVKDSSGTVTSPYTSSAVSGALVEVDYVQITSGVNITATSEATANTIVTANALSADGSTVYYVEFFCGDVTPSATATRDLQFWLYDGSSSIGLMGYDKIPASSADNTPVFLSRRLTPSNASHTYSVRGAVSAGTGVVTAGAGGSGTNAPAYIRIVKRTP